MKLTIQLFWEGEPAPAPAVAPFLKPLTLNFRSIDEARELAIKTADHENVPAHSFTIKSEDGKVSERWYQLDGAWRRKDIP
jgi:hypothetical protein